MARPAGLPKSGGRKRGTPNKKTLGLQEAFDSHGVDLVGQLSELLPQLTADKRADVLIDLMSYLYPKRKAIEHSGQTSDSKPQVIVTLPAKELDDSPEERKKRIIESYRKLQLLDPDFLTGVRS